MNVVVFGATGMLGRAMAATEPAGVRAAFPLRRRCNIANLREVDFQLNLWKPDIVINCAGITPDKARSIPEMIEANALGPQLIAEECRGRDIRFVHVSTDCVFDDSPYGMTKRLGEADGAVNIRTSFIGPDHGLWKWFADAGPRVEAWEETDWYGSTVWEVARKLWMMATDMRGVLPGTYDLGTTWPISKAVVLRLLQSAGVNPSCELVGVPGPNGRLLMSGHYGLAPLDEILEADYAKYVPTRAVV